MRSFAGFLGVLALAACGNGGGGAVDGGGAAIDGGARPDGSAAAPDASSPDGAAPGPSDLERLYALLDALPAAGDAERRALIDAFVDAVAYGERGFPIREDGQLAVVFLDESGAGGTLTVAGDFNGWNAGELPLLQPVAGLPFYYRIFPVAEPLPRTLYKFVRDGSEWFADPLARRRGYDAFGLYSLAERGDGSALERWPAFDDAAGALAPRDLTVYVPPGPAPAGGYRVVYMHDGQNLFDPEAIWGGWHAAEAAETALAAGVEPFLIVAVPNSPARMDEYTPVTEIVGGNLVGGRADEYVAFLVDGIKPFVDARYPTRTGPADTAVLGSSLGGVISFYALWSRPDVFGHAASLSGAFWWGSGAQSNPTMMHLFAQTAPPSAATFYLDSGGDDGGGCLDADGDGVSDDGNDSDGYCQTLDMLDVLESLGWTQGQNLVYRWSPGAQHNEAAWAVRLPAVFTDWFPGVN